MFLRLIFRSVLLSFHAVSFWNLFFLSLAAWAQCPLGVHDIFHKVSPFAILVRLYTTGCLV